MADNSTIEWTDHTYNPWIGCTKISEACDNCYAETWDKRNLHDKDSHWGAHAARKRVSQATLKLPYKWQKQARSSQTLARVFVASLADVFDNHPSIEQSWRDDIWQVIRECPDLDFLLLTKRPQNIKRYLPTDWGEGYHNVWLGTTVENQKVADRLDALTKIPAVVRFISCEPLLGYIDLSQHIDHLDWVIAGGENSKSYRAVDADWFRSLRDQCQASGTAFLFKQWNGPTSARVKEKGRKLDGIVHSQFPTPRIACRSAQVSAHPQAQPSTIS